VTGYRCLTYVPVPHLGWGWVQACVSILEAFPHDLMAPTLVLPRAFRAVAPSVDVRQAVPFPIPYQYASPFLIPALNHCFKRALDAADPRTTIVDFWPSPPLSLLRYARKRGFITVREMLNTYSGSAKVILDEAYRRLGVQPAHVVTEALVNSERDELQQYDYILSSSPRIEKSLIDAGVASSKILHSTFGWSPTELESSVGDDKKSGFRALFIGGDAMRKGIPQLLEAWHKSGVDGELLVVGEVDPALRPALAPYLEGNGVRLQGFTLDLAHLYKSADVFVFPSLEEGDPQVTYQAAGCGLPIIATPMGGGNLLRDGVNGLLVQPYDVDGLAAAIARLAKSPELRKRLGAQAAIDAKNYTYEKVGLERAKLLNSVLDARTRSSGRYRRSNSQGTGNKCLTYVPMPHVGSGWVQVCVSLLEEFPNDELAPTIVLPRAFRAIAPSVDVKQVFPSPIPYRYVSFAVDQAMNYSFRRAIAAADPRNTIVYFWPSPSLSSVRYARDRGFVTVREMINTCMGTAKVILDEAYERAELRPSHPITNDLAENEHEELELYDYLFAPSSRVADSLINMGVDNAKILRSTYGWSPSRLALSVGDERKKGFRALFVGTVNVRKGIPQLLAAWKKAGVEGELLLAGDVEDILKPLLAPYLKGHGVRLVGYVTDVGHLYKSADAFVFPTLEEGDPAVTYEAAACGLPIIATPMGGANVLRDGVNGLLVQPYDIDGLAAAIVRLANSPDLRKRLGSQAAIDAENYTYEKVGLERARILNGLLCAKASASNRERSSSALRVRAE
jgi:glycosyltransferase involved in cell wall biosynthesis